MEETRIYLLAEFDEATQRALAKLYGEIAAMGIRGRQTPNLPYHFTLGSADPALEGPLLERLGALCAKTPALPVRLNHIGLFPPGVLFAAPAMNAELLRLHDALFPGEPAAGSHDWVAHATLLIDDADAIERALPAVARAFSPIEARIERVGAYAFFPARFIRHIPLGG